ncbi:hypothetical protein B0H11DRAFT_1281178 [Mycena galericulata]|nr:hypothetical protein B0H11DRAFT_1281178 [Mycena galericulata]
MPLGDSYALTELPTPIPLAYSRVMRLRTFCSVGYLLFTRDKVIRDFRAFEEIESVWMHRLTLPQEIQEHHVRLLCACRRHAYGARPARRRPGYLVCGMRVRGAFLMQRRRRGRGISGCGWNRESGGRRWRRSCARAELNPGGGRGGAKVGGHGRRGRGGGFGFGGKRRGEAGEATPSGGEDWDEGVCKD